MKRLTTLLALTDLSAPSRHAMVRAAMLASENNAHLELLHVVEVTVLDQLRALLGSDAEQMMQQLMNESRNTLQQIASATCESRSVSPNVLIKTGSTLKEIPSHADACDAELIVLGVRGAGFLRQLLIGTTTERLLRKTIRPLLMVRQVPHEAYQRVLVPVDFSAWSIDSIKFARMVAPGANIILFNACEIPFEGKLQLAGVDEKQIRNLKINAQQEAKQNLDAIAIQAGLTVSNYRSVVALGDASSRILEQEQEQDIDLIVIGKHGKGMTEELLLGSTTKYILAQANCDVLVTQRN